MHQSKIKFLFSNRLIMPFSFASAKQHLSRRAG